MGRQKMCRLLLPLGLATVAGATLTGCAIASGNCAPVGMGSGVYVKYGAVAAAHRSEHLRARACLDHACRSFRIPVTSPGLGGDALMLGTATVKDATPRVVRLMISTSQGRVVFSGHVTATPREIGSACDGHAWETYVTATGTHTLTPAS